MTGSPNSPAERQYEETESEWAKRKARMSRDVILTTLETLGFDVDDIGEIQKDILFLRRLRKASETASAKTVAGIISVFFAICGAVATLAVQHFWPK